MSSAPLSIVGLSACSYGTVTYLWQRTASGNQDRRVLIKAVSSLHAALTTAATIYALNSRWDIDNATQLHGSSFLDDSRNPLIHGKSWLGNAITSWETGYLLYDTCALLWTNSSKDPVASGSSRGSLVTSAYTFAKRDPVTTTHHLSLLVALGALQVYIARGRERGAQVILAFILMNASTPFMHLRWWRRRVAGRANVGLDALFAVVFAAARFGVVAWVLRKYGAYHGLGAWEALRRQRLVCQGGTAALVGLNVVWWGLLVSGIVRRIIRGAGKGVKTGSIK